MVIYSSLYLSQSAWLRNASIKGDLLIPASLLGMLTTNFVENILFNLPYVEERYQRTLEVCALVNDLKILEDSDESEIGERGVHAPSSLLRDDTDMSHRSICLVDKKRAVSLLRTTDRFEIPQCISSIVSLARAVYSRASVLFLDDVLSAGECYTIHPRC